ncbi:MarR family transcriptional regulator [Gemmata sp. JC717]|uniref:MarR family winged helix-turn-helix transcriptional regulator n=1 Tax=Gemmata algarum TaxID=2975278 RepID=UPI0021BA58BB|nr:MarR family transcriptional regulator [Gemmata algarum]MDY3554153.1 MarR family transcriptional regulator [Gemmata algarum]
MAAPQRRFDSPEQEAFLGLWRTFDRLRALEDELFARYELTPQQYNALRLLRATQPGTLRTLDLAARLVSRAPDVTRMLDKLAEHKLVDRQRSEANRREVHVSITPAGVALLDELHAPLRECHARQLGHLSREQLRDLTALLRAARLPHEDADSSWR